MKDSQKTALNRAFDEGCDVCSGGLMRIVICFKLIRDWMSELSAGRALEYMMAMKTALDYQSERHKRPINDGDRAALDLLFQFWKIGWRVKWQPLPYKMVSSRTSAEYNGRNFTHFENRLVENKVAPTRMPEWHVLFPPQTVCMGVDGAAPTDTVDLGSMTKQKQKQRKQRKSKRRVRRAVDGNDADSEEDDDLVSKTLVLVEQDDSEDEMMVEAGSRFNSCADVQKGKRRVERHRKKMINKPVENMGLAVVLADEQVNGGTRFLAVIAHGPHKGSLVEFQLSIHASDGARGRKVKTKRGGGASTTKYGSARKTNRNHRVYGGTKPGRLIPVTFVDDAQPVDFKKVQKGDVPLHEISFNRALMAFRDKTLNFADPANPLKNVVPVIRELMTEGGDDIYRCDVVGSNSAFALCEIEAFVSASRGQVERKGSWKYHYFHALTDAEVKARSDEAARMAGAMDDGTDDDDNDSASVRPFSWSDSSSSGSDSDSSSDSDSDSSSDSDDACPFTFETTAEPSQVEAIESKITARLEDDGMEPMAPHEVVAAMMGYDSDYCGHGRGNKFSGVKKTGDAKRAAAQLLQNQSVKVRKDSGKKTDRRHRHHLLEMKRERLGTDLWAPCGFPEQEATVSSLEAAKAAKEKVLRARKKKVEAAKKPLAQKMTTSVTRCSTDTRPVQEGFSWTNIAKRATE